MKRKLTYLLPLLLIVVASGCLSNKNNNPAPLSPLGNFTGTFTAKHKNKVGVIDSVHANLTLDMALATGFKVTGDTTTVHAGSYGAFIVYNNGSILFADNTFPTTGKPAKYHLSGVYNYSYDGTTFQIGYISPTDTLSLYYKFKKN